HRRRQHGVLGAVALQRPGRLVGGGERLAEVLLDHLVVDVALDPPRLVPGVGRSIDGLAGVLLDPGIVAVDEVAAFQVFRADRTGWYLSSSQDTSVGSCTFSILSGRASTRSNFCFLPRTSTSS